jgi:DNA polymerase-3 subunit delta'
MIIREDPPHALLISGPRGVGKSTLAMDLAAGLLCLHPDPGSRPCRDCLACRKVDHGSHPDLHVVAPVGPGDQIRLPQVQALIAELALTPLEGRIRVAVVAGAQRLNPDAQNALLKTLEEPTGAACFVLCADDLAPLLPTVLSRTARLRLGPLPRSVVAEVLVEHGLADRTVASQIAAASGGMPGRAMVLAAEPEMLLARAALARQLLDLAPMDRRTRLASIRQVLADGLASDPPAAAPRDDVRERASGAPSGVLRPQPVERRRAAQRILVAWREIGRDLLVVAEGSRGSLLWLDLLEELESVASGMDRVRLCEFLDRLDGLSAAIDEYANPELALDDLALAWPSMERAA